MKLIHSFDKGIYNPFELSNVSIKSVKATKENRVLFTEDFFNLKDRREWEVRFDNGYPTVFYDPYIEKYRCYYSTFVLDESSSEVSLEERKDQKYNPTIERIVGLCYAESTDGINWTKPNLGITKWNGSKENNIIDIFIHGTSVMLDKAEVDPKKRYKMFTKVDYGNGVHYLAVAFSADGLHFGKYVKLNNFNPRADTYNYVFYEKDIGQYILITRIWRDSMRVPVVSYSKDFVNWSPVKEIMSSPTYTNQIYSMPFFKEEDYYIGLASVYHEGDRLSKKFDKVDLHLTYSYDKKNWHYIDLETPFIERGYGSYPDGAFDSGCLFASPPIEIDQNKYFYYLGGNGPHTDYRETSLARAYIKNKRFSYLSAKDPNKEATVYTNGFIFLSDQLIIDSQIESGGYLTVEFYTNNHQKLNYPIFKFTEEDNLKIVPIPKSLLRKITRLKIKFRNSKIYSFKGNIDIYRIENDNSLLRA